MKTYVDSDFGDCKTIAVLGDFVSGFSHTSVSWGIVEFFSHLKQIERVDVIDLHNHGPWQSWCGWDSDKVCRVSSLDSETDGIFVVGGRPHQIATWVREHAAGFKGWKGGLAVAEMRACEWPNDWRYSVFGAFDEVFVPSRWAAEQEWSEYDSKPIVFPHGVHPSYTSSLSCDPAWLTSSDFEFYHVAGAASYLERKGTDRLIVAFDHAVPTLKRMLKKRPILTIRARPTPQLRVLVDSCVHSAHYKLENGSTPLSPHDMTQRYYDANAVVQPSLAEAYGLVPMEAQGQTLVIASDCSGHKDHCQYPRDVRIRGVWREPTPANDIDVEGGSTTIPVQPTVETITAALIEGAAIHNTSTSERCSVARPWAMLAARHNFEREQQWKVTQIKSSTPSDSKKATSAT